MLNALWHKAHPMPKKPTFNERVRWHEEHVKACGCRDMPPAIRGAMRHRFQAE